LCFVGFVALPLLAGVVNSVQSDQPSPDAVQDASKVVEKFRASGFLVKFDGRGIHDAYVNPVMWAALDHDQKRNVTMTIATSCIDVGERQYVHIKDNMMGREIAQFYGGAYKAF
jgi:hypothetical protein